MVLEHIKNIFNRQLPPVGNLYRNKQSILESASIDVKDRKVVCCTETGEKEEFPIKDIEYLDFVQTESQEVGVMFVTGKTKWVFVFRKNLPTSVVQFYGKIASHMPEINGWKVIYTGDHASYMVYNHETSDYRLVDDNATISIIEIGQETFLRVNNQYKVYRKRDHIGPECEFYIDQGTKSFSWAASEKQKEECRVFRLGFMMTPSLLSFISIYLSVGKATSDETEYFEKMEIDNYGAEAEESDESEEEAEAESSDYTVHTVKTAQAKNPTQPKTASGNIFGGKTKEVNKALAVGKEKTFVSRGSNIGVFRNDSDELEFVTSVRDLAIKGNRIDPKKMLLTQAGESIILSDSFNPTHLYKLDLNAGKIAETWKTEDDLTDFFSSAKNTEGEPLNNEFLSISKNSIYKIDPRATGVVEGKKYATATKFSAGDANAFGEFAIGSQTGDIRMYDKLDKRAKTLLPGLGDAIIGMFISPSGRYIICTCKTYLMLVTTDANGVSGFKKSLGKEKPVPKKLRIRPEHLHHFSGEINFTNASISTDPEEKCVIVSTGTWVIIWDIQKVLKGEVFSYQIKENEHLVVSNSFVPGDNEKIVVAMDDDIQLIKRSTVKRPKKGNVYQKG
ncbi:hypothetical protein NEDG_01020 [Nematocida displodere]|uniref:Vacuolar import/degradation Vid27 C-terminal domain-containing protein n=1 Tax=Nematocida displodere TaxID=1805483 RepID=A0A177EBK2_9MICR|nr:hypothetical protein NEDG_01020 [Nematocida displodere]